MDRMGIATQLLCASWAFTGAEDGQGFVVRYARAVKEEYAALVEKHLHSQP